MNTIQYSPEAVRYMQQTNRVVDANDISIASAVFAELNRWQTTILGR